MPLFNSLGRLLPVAGKTSLIKLYCELTCIRPFIANVKLPSLLAKCGAAIMKFDVDLFCFLDALFQRSDITDKACSLILAFSSISLRIAVNSAALFCPLGLSAVSSPAPYPPSYRPHWWLLSRCFGLARLLSRKNPYVPGQARVLHKFVRFWCRHKDRWQRPWMIRLRLKWLLTATAILDNFISSPLLALFMKTNARIVQKMCGFIAVL